MKRYSHNKINLAPRLIAATMLNILLCFGCKKFIEIPPPVTQIANEAVFSNDQSANAAQLVIYAQMAAGSSYKISWYGGLSADELINYSPNTSLLQLYTNGIVANNEIIKGLWSDAYSYIYEENSIIENLQKSSGVSLDVKKQLTGEAKFIRAFWHFYLVNLYGDIPLVLTSDYQKNAVLMRNSTSDVYKAIISDLRDAKMALNDKYVGADGITETMERTRPTSWAVGAVLARVFLYRGDWVNASAEATTLINNTNNYNLLPALNEVFLANSNEAIWQLQPVLPNENTTEGYSFILSSTPSTVSINKQLLSAFDSGDNRKSSWIDSIIVGTDVYYYPVKYKVQTSDILTEYSMVLRLAEQYLIRSEANAQLGNTTAALTDLNIIRVRAGLPGLNINDKMAILDAILHERQTELFTEWSQRWLDIKRTGNVNSVMANAALFKGGVWNTTDQLYPIPQSERDNDRNLSQNPGY